MSPDEEEILDGFMNVHEFSFLKSGDLKIFDEDQEMKPSSKSSSQRICVGKKTKVTWTKDLHNKFLEAIGKLGIDNAVPKKIVELMKVDGLTRDHVASHLQKYRILSKKIANANYWVQHASKPSLLDSSMTNGDSLSNASLMLDDGQMNWPSYGGMHDVGPLILDTSSSYVPVVLEASNFNASNKGMEAMTKNLDEHKNFIDDANNFGVANLVNSGAFGFVETLDNGCYFYDHGGCPSEVQLYDKFEMSSLNGLQYSRGSSFVQNSNASENNYSSLNEFVEIGSSHNVVSNINLENGLGEGDLILKEVDIGNLLSYVYADDDIDLPVNPNLPYQDVINGKKFLDNVSSYSNYNEEPTSFNVEQTIDGYHTCFDPIFKPMDEQFLEFVRNPDADDMTFQGQILNSYLQA